MTIAPIPSTRLSNMFVIERLMSQVTSDQLELFRVQTAISTGRRLTVLSDDAPAALRAISLQSLLERKQQIKTNLATNQSYLSATDSAVGDLGQRLAEVRALAIASVGATSSSSQRSAAAAQVDQVLRQLVNGGNRLFRGRYLFAGSQTTAPPFKLVEGGVQYLGDQKSMLSYSDIDLLFETNVTGDSIFGAVSEPVLGSADLNPVLTPATRLADLHLGRGIRSGSIAVSDGANLRTVDIGSAATIGDVARLLEANPPAGRTITARVTAGGLTVQLDAAGGGNLTIAEVGGGTTAAELGIRNTTGVGTGPLAGSDLNPRLSLTTPLADILGVRASAILRPAGMKNDLVIESATPGPQFNGVTVTLVDDASLQAGPGLSAGNETVVYSPVAVPARASLLLSGPSNDLILTAAQPGTAFNGATINIVNGGNLGNAAVASYNAGTKTLTLSIDDSDQTTVDALIAAIALEGTFNAARDTSGETNVSGGVIPTASAGAGVANTRNSGGDAKTLFIHIDSGATTSARVAAAINAEGTFSARIDKSEAGNDGAGIVIDSFSDPAAVAVTAGGSGIAFDQASGLQIVNGGKTYTIDFATATTIEDVLNILNGAGAGLLAEINQAGTGINIRTRISGTDFSIGENGGTTAAELGIRSFHAGTPLADLNYGRGVQQVDGADFVIHRKDGVEFQIDLAGAQSIGDVLDLINNNAANLASGVPVVARLATYAGGIELVNDGPAGSDALSVRGTSSITPARDLGLLPDGSPASAPPLAGSVATAPVTSAGANNDLIFSATSSGTGVNGVTIRFVDTGLGAGNETVTYDQAAQTLTFNIDQPTTDANRVISLLAGDPLASQYFTASLAPADGSPNNGSGLIDLAATATLDGGTAETLTGRDTNPLEVRGVFAALIRLQQALMADDVPEIERAVALLDQSSNNVNFVRAELGARQQGLDIVELRLAAEDIELRRSLSQDLDVDLAQAISDFSARQAALEASLRAAGLTVRLTLLNFL